jgi:hypothetical protein
MVRSTVFDWSRWTLAAASLVAWTVAAAVLVRLIGFDCSQTAVCIRPQSGGCLPGPCDVRWDDEVRHVLVAMAVAVALTAAFAAVHIVRTRSSSR